jgi:hypothetical protein
MPAAESGTATHAGLHRGNVCWGKARDKKPAYQPTYSASQRNTARILVHAGQACGGRVFLVVPSSGLQIPEQPVSFAKGALEANSHL